MRRCRTSLAMLLMLPLAGCWQVPPPPADNSTDAYSWRAAIDLGGNEPYYRFDMPDKVSAWMWERDIKAFSVFDAAGALQQCRIMGASSNDPMATIEHVATASVREFDGTACRSDEPLVCFEGQPCAWPAYCRPKHIDLSATSLPEATSLTAMLAVANATAAAPNCTPDAADATRACDASDVYALREYRLLRARSTEARQLLANNHLGGPLQPDGTARDIRANLPSSYASTPPPPRSMIAMGGRGGATMPAPTPARYAFLPAQPTSLPSGGYLINFDAAPRDPFTLHFVWNATAAQGSLGNATLTCFNTSSAPSDHQMNIQPDMRGPGDSVTQIFSPRCDASAYRVAITRSDAADLALVAATALSHTPKPFIRKEEKTYWFKPEGKPPYSLYFEQGKGKCVGMGSSSDLKLLPQVTDPQWPPALRVVGVPEANPRSTWNALRSSNNQVVAWVYWAFVVGGAALLALLLTLLRWASLASRKVS